MHGQKKKMVVTEEWNGTDKEERDRTVIEG